MSKHENNKRVIDNFKNKRIHILGIAGTLMGPFAAYLKDNGIEVTGSDQNIYPPISDVLKNAKIEVYSPFSKENLFKAKPDLVIVGNVIKKTNPEMESVVENAIPYLSLPSAMEEMILPHKHSIVVTGTHGKTTTTSMMAWILESIGENPSFFVGGVLQNFPNSFRVTDSKLMVLEGDEYDTAYFDKVPKFVHYRPKDVILTSIEYDHADIYPNIAAVITAFEKLATLVPKDGYFITCAETETPLRIAHESNAHVITYGFGSEVDSQATQIEVLPTGGVEFKWNYEINKKSEQYRVQLNCIGKHNILNALACLTLCAARQSEFGNTKDLDLDKVIQALKTYTGVKRRQEIFEQIKGITIIDDFAHHPTAVRETLLAVRSKHPKSRLIACFEPRSATSRRKVFQTAYAESFDEADLIFIAKPYDQTQIDPSNQFSAEDLIEDLQAVGKRARLLSTSQAGIKDLTNEIRSGDVVLVMSNGSFDGLLTKLKESIAK